MAIYAAPICIACTRLHAADIERPGMFCDAFPGGIPEAILVSRADHRQPFEGDHGLQFLAKSPAADAQAARILEIAREMQQPPQPQRPVIDLDADPDNANWLRRAQPMQQ